MSVTLARATLALAVGIAAFAVVAGCESYPFGSSDPRPTCTPSREPGLAVTVLDSLTGAPPLESATIVVVDGAYVDTLDGYAPGWPAYGAWERRGTYDLYVTAPGYLEWTRAGMR